MEVERIYNYKMYCKRTKECLNPTELFYWISNFKQIIF